MNTMMMDKAYLKRVLISSVQVMDIDIQHDNSGNSPNWFLDSVAVEVGCQGKKYTYEYNGWLNESDTNVVSLPPTKVENIGKSTVTLLNFQTPENFPVIFLKFKQRGQSLRVFCQKDANGIANSVDPDQTAPLGLFAQTYLSEDLGSLR